MAVDGQVSSNVPSLVRNSLRLTAGDMLEDQVVELMLENTTHMLFRQAGKEVRVVNHFELGTLGIYPNTSSWNIIISTLLNLAA